MSASNVCYTPGSAQPQQNAQPPFKEPSAREPPAPNFSRKSLPQRSLLPEILPSKNPFQGRQTASLQRAFLNETSQHRASPEITFLKGASLQRGCLRQRTLLLFKNFPQTEPPTEASAEQRHHAYVLCCSARRKNTQLKTSGASSFCCQLHGGIICIFIGCCSFEFF